MKKARIAIITAAVMAVFGGSLCYVNNFWEENPKQIIEDIKYDYTDEITEIDDYEVYINDFILAANNSKSSDSQTLKCKNKYGTFTLSTENGKIKKYKYGDVDTSQKYLVKGTAAYSKKNITFDGYFLVDNTLTKYKKGQLTMYKGKLTLPNGDKFDGTLSKGKYYLSGTYTWKNGQSFKGQFTISNKI